MSELSKSYDPSGIEQSTYERWLQSGIFSSSPNADKKPYSILMPPPNVTGVLTMGHVINNTIQDIYIRRHRMEGMETCWFPGLDHAGIATQTKVEQQLRESKLTRHDLGREKFLEKVWEWRNQYGDIILKQMRSIGISCDWNRTLFTMDESASNAVRETFIRLFDEGLIYRGKRIINWSPVAQSALSDEEVLFREVKEHIYTLRYHFESGNGWLNVATVRPETIFGDVAVAVNPNDERYKHLIGVMERLKELDLIEKVEDYTHNVGFSERGGEPVEPYLSDQWFVNMKPLAEPALKAVLEGDVKFYPNHWVKTYEHWMSGIRDWCISRQLWWGHRIPVYYAEDGTFTAAASEEQARQKLGLPVDAKLVQDPDVLDTWFSSWLWPMTTMQWLADGKTEDTDDMSFYLPSNLLVTGPDIIFFWVARMIMASLKFTGKIPFRDVYFTSIIRDGKGKKMSKSLGNSPDPLNVIDKYGADALRFTIVYLAPLGTDVRLEVKEQDVPQVELGRNFANKIWNAGRFLMMKREENPFAGEKSILSEDELTAADKWIRSRYHSTIKNVGDHLSNYRITEYARTLHEFIWRDFCDWYVEILKSQINASENSEAKARMVHFAMSIFDGTMRLLHPVMPFISETLWQELATEKSTDMICNALNPQFKQEYVKQDVEESFELLQMLVEEVRKMRSLANIQNHQKLPLILRVPDADISAFLLAQSSTISSLGRASAITIAPNADKPDNALSSVIRGIDIFIETAGAIDQEKEKARLTKEADRLSGLIRSIEGKLNNPGFVSKAPEQVVKAEQEKLDSIKDSHAKILENLSSLG